MTNAKTAVRLRAAPWMTVQHASDCATHNEPALPAGPCDCGAATGLAPGYGIVKEVGWDEIEGESVFRAIITFPEGPPDLAAAIVWNSVPVDIVPREHSQNDPAPSVA